VKKPQKYKKYKKYKKYGVYKVETGSAQEEYYNIDRH